MHRLFPEDVLRDLFIQGRLTPSNASTQFVSFCGVLTICGESCLTTFTRCPETNHGPSSQRHRRLPLHRYRGQHHALGADQQAMAAAVQRHFALLHEAIAAQDGVLFKTIGDAVQAAFPTVPKAIAAAIARPDRAAAGGLGRSRAAARADGDSRRRGDAARRRLPRPRTQSACSRAWDRIWGADPADRYGARPRHDAPRWLCAPGSGQAPAARPARGRTHLPALRTWTAGRLPAAEESRSAAEQPSGATYGADRPGATSSPLCATCSPLPKPGSSPSSAPAAPARPGSRCRPRPSRWSLPRWRLVGAAGRRVGPGPGAQAIATALGVRETPGEPCCRG